MAAPPTFHPLALAEAVDAFLNTVAARVDISAASGHTATSYAQDLADLVNLAGADRILDEIEVDDLQVILASQARIPDRRKAGTAAAWDAAWSRDRAGLLRPPAAVTHAPVTRSAASRARFAATLRSFFAWAHSAGYVRVDPMPQVPTPKAPVRATGARLGLDAIRTTALLDTTTSPPPASGGGEPGLACGSASWVAARDEVILRLLAETGMRVSEVAAADISHLHAGQYPAGHDLHPATYAYLDVVGKGRKARRVPLSDQANTAVTRWLQLPRPPSGPQDAAALIVSVRGRRLAPRDIQRILDRRIQQMPAALRTRVTPHGLRHTAATVMVRDAGVDPATAAHLLGHASIVTTSTYLDDSDPAAAQAVQAAAKAYDRARPAARRLAGGT